MGQPSGIPLSIGELIQLGLSVQLGDQIIDLCATYDDATVVGFALQSLVDSAPAEVKAAMQRFAEKEAVARRKRELREEAAAQPEMSPDDEIRMRKEAAAVLEGLDNLDPNVKH